MKILSIATWVSIVLIIGLYVYNAFLLDFTDNDSDLMFSDQRLIWGLIVGSVTLIGILMMKSKYEAAEKKVLNYLFAICPFLYVFSILIYLFSSTFFQFEGIKILIMISTLLNLYFFTHLSFSKN